MAKTRVRYHRVVSHGSSDAHDLCLYTRWPRRILIDDLSNLWNGDPDASVSLFQRYNQDSFSFLSIEVSDDGTALTFLPSEKVGCAPLFSPVTGKQCATITVKGNMNEDISEVLPLIEGDIDITFSNELILPYEASIKPPIYFECAKYIDQYIKAKRIHWKKFVSEVKIEKVPSASTQWAKYASNSYDPQKTLRYPNKKNLLSINHSEWRELNYVLKMCLEELSASHTPRASKLAYKEKVEGLRRDTDFTNITKPTELRSHTSDPLEIKKLKEIGNRIINSFISDYRAWSVDFSQLYERYVQYIFKLVSTQIGWQSYSNSKFSVFGSSRNWTLSYIEPDILLKRGDRLIVADAKYKMHMMNTKSESVDSLKEAFRHDLHQILAYSSFEKDEKKFSMIVYPSKTFMALHQQIRNPFIGITNDVYLVGIPWGECYDGDTILSMNKKVTAAVNGIVQIINSGFYSD